MTKLVSIFSLCSLILLMGVGCTEVQSVIEEVGAGAQNVYEHFGEGYSSDEGSPEEVTELTRFDGAHVQGNGFSLQVPENWLVDASSFTDRSSTGARLHGWISNGVSNDAYTDPDIITITIKDVEKEGRTQNEIVSEFGWDESDIDARVQFMQEYAYEKYWITAADVSVKNGAIEINGAVVPRSEMRCEKTCYLEGSAVTTVLYAIEGDELVYLVSVATGTNEQTDVFLAQAEEVIKTFVISE
ncbi:hypothetical protein A2239_00310 [Candidatus Uhrbacteria bacterium RIFOXYA2_FULL_40_9]|nr:MAG: hypothetical protein UT94_C0034G0022 [Candidatus Uhrbacteria bacterium GW2011_GWF2_40_263]OGL93861.1 MAG: hypothetical protein A2239_00310 [Candidatus Uhrbacteria bacterium RIFOXYA2_FULL_40_9]OGL97570.1 MAG: hypothetical protein A2332_03485 [Candidatus Uhrbacteria bacterium RIFOXYB2_FULL_41_18]HBK34887.1 hypothetical protein [Candidatus Uhrbacteria bacterium]HCB56095.1 hypothetical protein [Candidatus Uhrbacteria bacterium]